MRVQRTKDRGLTWIAFGIAAITCADVGARQAPAAPHADRPADEMAMSGRLGADLTIRQQWVDERGQAVPGAPLAHAYRLERSQTSRGWSTELTLVSMDQRPGQPVDGSRTPDDPFLITRMVHDDRRGLRLFNRAGDQVRGPNASDRRLLRETGVVPDPAPADDFRPPVSGTEPPARTSAGWLSRLIVSRADRAERAEALRATLGSPVDQIRGLDRHVVAETDGLSEVLVDPEIALPVEMNIVRGGVLVVRTRMAYDAIGSDLLLRRRALTERVLPGGRGGRVITDVELSNVVVTTGGAQ